LNSYGQYGIIAHNHFVSGDRKADEGGASSSPRTVYAISNQGSKTLFTEDHTAKEGPLLIRPFDDFQENLLRNYTSYCESVRRARQTASIGSGP
jgi:hypothetical protein